MERNRRALHRYSHDYYVDVVGRIPLLFDALFVFRSTKVRGDVGKRFRIRTRFLGGCRRR